MCSSSSSRMGTSPQTIVRQFLFDAHQIGLWEGLSASEDVELAGIAARALKEARYHFEFSSGWMVRLGDGTPESKARTQRALDSLWRFTSEISSPGWLARVESVVSEATLDLPTDPYRRSGGREGFHTEHLGPLLAELQWMDRSYPGLEW